MCVLAKHFHSHFCGEKIFLLYLLNGEKKKSQKEQRWQCIWESIQTLAKMKLFITFPESPCVTSVTAFLSQSVHIVTSQRILELLIRIPFFMNALENDTPLMSAY